MGVKISELTSATSLTGNEELPIVQGGNTKKSTISQVKNNQSVLTAWNTSSWTNPTQNAYNTIAITEKENFGDVFSLADNKVTCLKDTTFSFSMTASVATGTASQNKFIRLAKNGTQYFGVVQRVNANVIQMSMSNIIISAQAGDYFTIDFYGLTNDSIDVDRLYVSFVTINPLATATQTRSTNLTMNTGALVGSGEKSNLLLDELESGDEATNVEANEVKENSITKDAELQEISKVEDTERSGDEW